MIGSVTASVVKQAKCIVMIVPSRIRKVFEI